MKKEIGIVLALVGIAVFVGISKEFTDRVSTQFLNWCTYPAAPGQATKQWFLTDFFMALRVCACYLILVAIGLWLHNGKDEGEANPLVDTPVKYLMNIYNLVQCVLCTYMIWGTIQEYKMKDYSLNCNKFNVNETGMASLLHLFYLSKIFDFCDTFFIIVRQKWKQFSFLHIYHHLSIFMVYWMNINAGYDGDIYVTIVLNSFVHLVMYSYYFLMTLGYNAWWKNYITLLQMGQFLAMNLQAIHILYSNCAFPHNITWFYLIYIVSLFILFQNFYNRTYSKRPQKPKSN